MNAPSGSAHIRSIPKISDVQDCKRHECENDREYVHGQVLLGRGGTPTRSVPRIGW